MKRKNIISGLLAGALVLTSVVVPGVQEVKAEDYDLSRGLVASFSFENSLSGGNDIVADAITVPANGTTQNYDNPVYDASGREDSAIRLQDGYGLQLNTKNIGDNFTVSMWVKPDGNINDNINVLFMGYNNPEKWLSVSGSGNNSTACKVWANGSPYAWTPIGSTTDITSGEWHQITVTGSSSTVTAYLDGEIWITGATNAPLTGENQDIRIGATYWKADSGFEGLVDEVKVYNRTLSAGEAYRLYDSTTSVEALIDRGITVTDSMDMVRGRTQQIDVSMNPVVEESNPAISYISDNTEIATVSEDGVVTGIGDGTTTITTSVTIGNTTEAATTTVNVNGDLDQYLEASFDFEDNLENGVSEGTDASAMARVASGTGMENYSGALEYVNEGKTGKAVRLGDYGLKLNQQDIGEEYTVSLWIKQENLLTINQSVILLGYHDEEKWLAISGSDMDGTHRVNDPLWCRVKFWGNGGTFDGHTNLVNVFRLPEDEWHQITITGTAGSTTLYMDGISLGTFTSNDPLDGKNQDIYLGVNNWDKMFTGLVDDVKVYSIAMNEAEVQAQAQNGDQNEFQQMLQAELDDAVTRGELLGENESWDSIKYDLELPQEENGLDITWTSSNPSVIANDGTLTSPAASTVVTMTGTAAYGTLSAEVEFEYTVAALDLSDLNELITQANAVDLDNLTAESKSRLESAISTAEAAVTYEDEKDAYARLELALNNLDLAEEVVNPFEHITHPVAETSLKEGETQDLFTVPDSVKDLVTVSYSPKDNSIVTYNNGTITAVGEGKAIVTATVTSKYDSFTMEYSTAVEVTSSGSSVDEGEVTDATVPANNAGNADLAGDSEALADAVLTEDDKEEVANGADAQIYLEVEDITDSVPEADKALVEEAKGAAQVGMYLDVTLWKQIGSVKPVAVENTNGTVTITFTVPASLRNTDPAIDRTYQIIRVHDGKAEILACSYDKNSGIITFTTDKFSTYALVYTDKKVEVPDPAPGTGEDKPGNGSQNKDDGKDNAPQTGDTTNVYPMAAACVLAFTAAGTIVAVKVKRRK